MRHLLTYSVDVHVVPRPSLVSTKGTAAVRYDSRTRDAYYRMKAIISGAVHAHLPADWEPVAGPIESLVVIERDHGIRPLGEIFKLTAPDVHDNLLKGLIDAHSGIVFKDDKQIVSSRVSELYSDADRVTFRFNLLDAEGSDWVWRTLDG